VQVRSGIVMTIFVTVVCCGMMAVEIMGAILVGFPYRKNSVGCRGSLTIQNLKDNAWFGQLMLDIF